MQVIGQDPPPAERAAWPEALAAALARARVEVDLDRLAANVAAVRRLLAPGTRLMAVLKGDAYGHGDQVLAHEVLRAGADWLGTASVAAAVRLREAGVRAPLLVFDPPRDRATARLWPRWELRAVVWDAASLALAAWAGQREGRPVAVHVEVDLGFGRGGVAPEEAAPLLAAARRLGGVRIEGLCCHLAAARRPGAARRGWRRFARLVADLERAGLRPPLVHCAESALLVDEPATQLDLVRVGNLLYGYGVPARGGPAVKPVSRLRTQVLAVTPRRPGAVPGYRGGWARRARVLATLGVGLADGVGLVPRDRLGVADLLREAVRRLLGRLGRRSPWPAWVVDGRRLPLRGELLMSHCLVDATGLDLVPGQEVELELPRLTAAGRLPVAYLRQGRVAAVAWAGTVYAAADEDAAPAGG